MSQTFHHFDYQQEPVSKLGLINDAFPHLSHRAESTVEYYLWKFHGLPRNPSSWEYATYDDGKLVGYYAALPYRYQIGRSILNCGMVCDVMTHSSMRRKGLFTQLGRYSLGQLRETFLDFCSGFPIQPQVIAAHLKMGWNVLLDLPVYLLVTRSRSLCSLAGCSLAAPVVDCGVSAYLALTAPREKSSEGSYYDILEMGNFFSLLELDSFLDQWAMSVKNHLVKNREFLNWRYSLPTANYKTVCVWLKGRLAAIAFTRSDLLKGIPTLALLDVLCVDNQTDCLLLLHRGLRKLAADSNVDTISIMCNRSLAVRLRLLRFGFIRSPYTFKFIVNIFRDGLTQTAFGSEQDWHLTWADCDDM